MAIQSQKGTKRWREQESCRFCRDKVVEVDYKDLQALTKLISSRGKIFSRKRSGNCAQHQRSAQRAIKHARFLGLLSFQG
jgi:small subunit ribosomal protein S18